MVSDTGLGRTPSSCLVSAHAYTYRHRTWINGVRLTGPLSKSADSAISAFLLDLRVRLWLIMATRGPMWGWELFFEELSLFLCSLQRQHGTANESFSHYALERIEISRGSLESLLHQMRTTVAEGSLSSSESATITECCMYTIVLYWMFCLQVLAILKATYFWWFYVLFGMRKWMVVVSTQKGKITNRKLIFKDFKVKFQVE